MAAEAVRLVCVVKLREGQDAEDGWAVKQRDRQRDYKEKKRQKAAMAGRGGWVEVGAAKKLQMDDMRLKRRRRRCADQSCLMLMVVVLSLPRRPSRYSERQKKRKVVAPMLPQAMLFQAATLKRSVEPMDQAVTPTWPTSAICMYAASVSGLLRRSWKAATHP